MSTRERWIVYPLLFLALGTAIKPKLAPRELRATNLPSINNLRVGLVECRQLSILGPDEEPRVIARVAPGGGLIRVIDNNRQTVVAIRADAATRAGLVETRNEHGGPQAMMMSSAMGGEMMTYDNVPLRAFGIGHRDGRSGHIETSLQTDQTWFLPYSEESD